MKSVPLAIPFAYCAACIVAPIYLFDTGYAVTVAILFWVPTALLLALNAGWMTRKGLWRPFWLTNAYLALVACYFEFTSLGMKIWDFSESHHRLLPLPRLFGTAPVEEFAFYFGATPFCLLLYITFYRMLDHGRSRAWIPEEPAIWKIAWLLVGLVFLPIIRFMYGLLKKERVVSWPALALATSAFWLTLALVEAHCVRSGHWVYHPGRSLHIVQSGIFAGIAIEEFFYYYIAGPVFVALFFHLMEIRPKVETEPSRLGRWDLVETSRGGR